MTDERQALFELIEKRADTDFVRELLAFAAERLMAVLPATPEAQVGRYGANRRERFCRPLNCVYAGSLRDTPGFV